MADRAFAPRFLEGVAHFNAREFWDAHESWEELWLDAETDMHQFLQGLIQLAAAYHHAQRGTFPGGVRLFDAALAKLAAFPRQFCGIDRSAAEEAAPRHRAWIAERIGSTERLDADEYPQLARDASPMPSDVW